MELIPVEIVQDIANARDVKAYVTPGGFQILLSINQMDSLEELQVSVGGEAGYPPDSTIREIIALFFDAGVKPDVYRNLSSQPPPLFMVHIFGPVPVKDQRD